MFKNTALHLEKMRYKKSERAKRHKKAVYVKERAYTLLSEEHGKRMAEFSRMQLTKDKDV